jgi:GNAT superfamily N-acetyltransferase
MGSSSNPLDIRRATAADAAVVAEHRVCLFADTGRLTPERAGALRALLPNILAPMLDSGEYIGWLVVAEDGTVVGGAGVQMRHLLPRPETLTEREALVVNVYIAPAYRRQGLARRLLEAILAWSASKGIERVALHPSAMGRPLYESLGFAPTDELVYYVRQTPNG